LRRDPTHYSYGIVYIDRGISIMEGNACAMAWCLLFSLHLLTARNRDQLGGFPGRCLEYLNDRENNDTWQGDGGSRR
jgi:hypothetical protein